MLQDTVLTPRRSAGFPRKASFVLALVVLGAQGGGCSSSDPAPPALPLVQEDGCQPLLSSTVADETSRARCLLPYPSDFWRKPDASTPTGSRIRLAPSAQPRRATGEVADPHETVVHDGASTTPMLVAALPGDVSRDGLPSVNDELSVSEGPDSPTVIIEADTGKRVAHYVDLFDTADGDPYEPLVLRAFAPLAPRTRYIVALRGVRAGGDDAAGRLAEPAAGFRRLRDGELDKDPALAAISARMNAEVLDPLTRAGVDRKTLQLAWDFTTGSVESPMRDMLRVRELTLAHLAAGPPAIRVTQSTDGDRGFARIVRIEMDVPQFLTSDGVDAKLVRGANGEVEQRGIRKVAALVCIPNAAWNGKPAGRPLAYGHGFFGSTEEVESATGRAIAERLGAVTFGTTWTGMAKDDLSALVGGISDHPETIADFAERVHQAMASWIVLTAAMQTSATSLAELKRTDGTLAYDPTRLSYFGASQGHILGGVLFALAPRLERAIFNVGGGGYAHMLPRSTNFGAFGLALDLTFKDARVSQAFLSMFQRAMDGVDPAFWAPYVTTTPLPGSPPARRVLMQIGLGDSAVPNAASFYHARALGLVQLTPSPKRVPGLVEGGGGPGVNALTVFDYGVDTSSAAPRPTGPNPVHDSLRLNERALRQMDAFLAPDGVMVQPCDGPCDPE